MKVYVDEFPKCCLECQLECPYEDRCVDTITMNCSECIGRPKDCPLQPLADYTKQVRKEVCEEIRNKIEQAKLIYEWKGEETTIEDILDQIQD